MNIYELRVIISSLHVGGRDCMNENLEKFFKTVIRKTYQRDKKCNVL
jgi:hypothetical protein